MKIFATLRIYRFKKKCKTLCISLYPSSGTGQPSFPSMLPASSCHEKRLVYHLLGDNLSPTSEVLLWLSLWSPVTYDSEMWEPKETSWFLFSGAFMLRSVNNVWAHLHQDWILHGFNPNLETKDIRKPCHMASGGEGDVCDKHSKVGCSRIPVTELYFDLGSYAVIKQHDWQSCVTSTPMPRGTRGRRGIGWSHPESKFLQWLAIRGRTGKEKASNLTPWDLW